MTIENGAQLGLALDQIGRLYRILEGYQIEFGNSRQFPVLAEGVRDEIRGLQADVDTYTGARRVEEAAVPLWIRISGTSIEDGVAPLSVLTAVLDSLRKGVQSAAEFLTNRELSTRPTAELKRACDLRAVRFEAGSLRVGVELPETQPALPLSSPEQPAAARALQDYLFVARWAGSGEDEEALARLVPDEELRRLLLTEVLRLVPRPRGDVESVELTGRYMGDRARALLTRGVRERVHSAIDRTTTESVESHVGFLREIDLDQKTFIIRSVDDAVDQIACEFQDDLWETAKDALDKKVQVTVVRKVSATRRAPVTRLRVLRLDVLE